jgi:hypothetical protein
MAARPYVVLVLAGALASLGASYRTPNFLVRAPTPAIAQQVGRYAEHYRREKALLWLGQEMPPWGQPCPLQVTVTMNGSGGATSFAFDRGSILSMDMRIEGSLDRILASVLPHEVTHTVFAHYFRCPVPRWADEGGSVLSEDDQERQRHDAMIWRFLQQGRAMPLRRLFSLTRYPRDVMVLYAQGYSVTSFLVGQSGRARFLAFVAQGMRSDWDSAVQTHYRYRSVEELEQAWLQHLRTQRRGGTLLARGQPPRSRPVNRQVVVRQTMPPAQPLLQAPRPVIRGLAPGDDPDREPTPPPRPRREANPSPWRPAPPPIRPSHPGVRLGPPRFADGPDSLPPQMPYVGSPVGFPYPE